MEHKLFDYISGFMPLTSGEKKTISDLSMKVLKVLENEGHEVPQRTQR